MQPLDSLFEALKLDHLAQQVDALLEQAAKKDLGYREMASVPSSGVTPGLR